MASLSEVGFTAQGGKSNEQPMYIGYIQCIYRIHLSGEQYGYTILLYYSLTKSATPISQLPGSTTPRNCLVLKLLQKSSVLKVILCVPLILHKFRPSKEIKFRGCDGLCVNTKDGQ